MSANSDKSPKDTNHEKLKNYIKTYLASTYKTDELEIRFGTNYRNKITKIKFDNVIGKIKSLGFKTFNDKGSYHLNINNQYQDERSGKTKVSNIRTEIRNLSNIQKYCNQNSFDFDIVPYYISFMQKYIKSTVAGDKLNPIDYNDFEFRVNYKVERFLKSDTRQIEKLLSNWNRQKKIFRYIKRFTFTHVDFPFKIDFSIVKTSKKKKYLIPEYNIKDADVFNNPENYEIEIELIKNECQRFTEVELIKKIKTGIKYILCGLQNSNYPISYHEQEKIQKEYLTTTNGRKIERRINNGDFVGPSSISLEMPNIIQYTEKNKIPNINEPYTVTEKADGIRKLLYVSNNGKIFMIDMNMNVQFTGCITRHPNNFNSILDGEHVLYDKHGSFINHYLCFDIYYVNRKDVRSHPQIYADKLHSSTKYKKEDGRLYILNQYLETLDLKYISKNMGKYFIVKAKTFYHNLNGDIFSKCKIILDGIKNETMFQHETDGLIFTPINKSVSSDKLGVTAPPRKRTWDHSFKWKPSEFNTIDFLVTTKKNENGTEFVGNIIEDGQKVSAKSNILQYKTLVLRVGYSEKRHGYINPCQDIYDDNIINKYDYDENQDDYRPAPFVPTDPMADFPIYLCNQILKSNGNDKYLTTENGEEIFTDNMIVEFRFDKNSKKFWQWIPIRVRYDKTAEYRNFQSNYGNSYITAQSVWRSINNPITDEMLSTGKNIPKLMEDDNIYYNTNQYQNNTTQSMRDFHNKYVKRNLILGMSKPGNSLMDMTVGKAGDLMKWIDAKLSFVYGIDVSKDNIENRKDGACARYLNARKKFNSIPDAIFLHGDSGRNIKNGDAFEDEKTVKISKAIYGKGAKDMTELGKGIYKKFGKAKGGFDIISNQFSIHYFFKNEETLRKFVENVSDNCKLNGHFIGTCYDGRKIFKMLENKKYGESHSLKHEGNVQWEVQKLYNEETFENNEKSIGYKINVFQESINKKIPEYLVNFDYFVSIMNNYGFVPAPIDSLNKFKLKKAISSFVDLFDKMNDDIKSRRLSRNFIGKAQSMTRNEKTVSFLNNYFIFKKIREPEPSKVSLSLTRIKQPVRSVVKYKMKFVIKQ